MPQVAGMDLPHLPTAIHPHIDERPGYLLYRSVPVTHHPSVEARVEFDAVTNVEVGGGIGGVIVGHCHTQRTGGGLAIRITD